MPVSVFDEIAAVPWADLHHANGPATDVPDLLRALMSPEAASPELVDAAQKSERSVFELVTSRLRRTVVTYETVFQVTATTVPFFAAILRDGPADPEHKAFLIDYLHHLAIGELGVFFPDVPNPDESFAAVEGLEDPGGEPDHDENVYLHEVWARDCYLAVERHIQAVLPYLDADDDQVSDAAIALCGSFPRCAEQTVPLLRRLVAKPDRRGANAAVSLAVIEGPGARQLAETIAASPDPLASVLGACAAALADADNASTEVVTILTRPLGALSETRCAHASTLDHLVRCCFERLGPDFRDRAAAAMCDELVHAGPEESLAWTKRLIKLAFEHPPMPPPFRMSATQRRALEVIRDLRDHGVIEISDLDVLNYALLLSYWLAANCDETWLRTG